MLGLNAKNIFMLVFKIQEFVASGSSKIITATFKMAMLSSSSNFHSFIKSNGFQHFMCTQGIKLKNGEDKMA